MKKCLILLAVALTGIVSKAENYALKVTLYGNTSATYVLDDKPVVSYSGNNVIIRNQSVEDVYSIDEVESFTFVESVFSGIETITQNVTYDFRNNIFTCEGHDIRVFSLSGQSAAAGNSAVSLEGLDRGVYIVTAGNRSIKVIKK